MAKLTSLRIIDYTDRELLHMLNDVADEEGWATTEQLVKAIGLVSKDNDPGRPRRSVATRFTWMRRFGWVERNEEHTAWRLTREGADLMNGSLRRGLQKSLKSMRDGDRVLLMREMATAYREAPRESAIMFRREWIHGTKR